MGLLNQHLLKESAKEKVDKNVIDRLDIAIETGNLSFNQWQDSGRFINRHEFEADNPDENLHIDCTDVVVYLGNIYIQVHKNGDFYLNPSNVSKNINDIEHILWDKNESLMWG